MARPSNPDTALTIPHHRKLEPDEHEDMLRILRVGAVVDRVGYLHDRVDGGRDEDIKRLGGGGGEAERIRATQGLVRALDQLERRVAWLENNGLKVEERISRLENKSTSPRTEGGSDQNDSRADYMHPPPSLPTWR